MSASAVVVLNLLALVATDEERLEAADDQAPPAAADDDYGFEVFAVPLYVQSPDAGPTGLGAASFYLHDGHTRPYKLWVSAVTSVSLYGVFSTLGYFEWVRPFDAPLRLTLSGGYQSSLAARYCGRGNAVTCDDAAAMTAADELSLAGEARETFLRRYYQYRFHGPLGTGHVRWMVKDFPHRVEAVLGVRGYGYLPGSVGFSGLVSGPYAGSRYADDHRAGETGLLNVVEAGLMLDNRDREAGPSRGYWLEASMRSASQLTLSAWSFGGVNVTARGYLPLRKHGALVLAERVILDAMVGDVPTYELQRVGGTWAFPAFGGKDVGRGLREGRVMGRIKAISQTELRIRFFRFDIYGVSFDLGGAGFLDAAWVADSWRDVGGDPTKVNFGFGAGLRLRIAENLLFRIEVAVSPDERWAPQLYLWPGFPY